MADVSKEMAEKNHYDLIQIEDVIMAQYFNDHMQNIPKILDMHNVESNLLCRYAEKDGNFFKRIYAKLTASKLEKYEVGISEKFSSVLTCSSDDGALLMKNGVNIPVRVVPNGVDCEYFKPDHNADSFSKDLVFVGSMDYHANRTGVIFFVNHILPLIIKKLPDVHFFIVGKNPTKEVCSLACEKITVTGMVPDVREYLKRAKVVVVPLLVGGGTRLKILEAMSMARPVVSTSLGAEGIGAIHKKHIFLADDPSSFSASIVKLLNDFELSKQMGVSASQFINDNYCWNKIQDELLSFINGQFT
jgi:glycosyltransferase involved in cell wall biosynthesis